MSVQGGAVLRLRKEQMEAFEAAARGGFARRVADYLRGSTPAVTAQHDPASLLAAVLGAIRAGEALGIVTEWDLCRFARFALGAADPRGELPTWALAILGRRDLDGGEKMDRLEHTAARRRAEGAGAG